MKALYITFVFGSKSTTASEIENLTQFRFEEKNYVYINERLSWTDALKTCRSYSGDLVTVRSFAENKFLGDYICQLHGECSGEDVGVWIGYFLKQSEEFQLLNIRGEAVKGFKPLIKGWRMNEWNYEYERIDRLESSVDLGNGFVLE